MTTGNADPKGALMGIAMTPVTTVHQVSGGANRDPATITVKKTGYAYSNSEGTDYIRMGAKLQEIPWPEVYFSFGANAPAGLVGIYLVRMGAPGAMAVRDSEGTLSFHLGGVFKEHSDLRPKTTVECGIVYTKDDKGQPCFIINIGSALPKRKGRRKEGDSTEQAKSDAKAKPAQEVAAAEQEPDQPDKK